MKRNALSVEVFTTGYRILGKIQPGGMGLYTFVNTPTKSYIEIGGAHLNRLHQPGKLVARYPKLWLVKKEIMALLLSNRTEIGPTGGARRGYMTSVASRVHISLGGYELIGTIETAGKFEFGGVMFEGGSLFKPLFDAELVATLYPQVSTEAAAVLFNRDCVEAMALLPREGTT
jgi:hypothetical protein